MQPKLLQLLKTYLFLSLGMEQICSCIVSGLWVGGVLWDGWPAGVNVVARLHVCMCSLPNWWTLHSEHSRWSHSPGTVVTDHVLLIRQPARDSISNI